MSANNEQTPLWRFPNGGFRRGEIQVYFASRDPEIFKRGLENANAVVRDLDFYRADFMEPGPEFESLFKLSDNSYGWNGIGWLYDESVNYVYDDVFRELLMRLPTHLVITAESMHLGRKLLSVELINMMYRRYRMALQLEIPYVNADGTELNLDMAHSNVKLTDEPVADDDIKVNIALEDPDHVLAQLHIKSMDRHALHGGNDLIVQTVEFEGKTFELTLKT